MSTALKTTSAHPEFTVVGKTQASSVIPVVRSSEEESGTFTSDEPEKLSPEPNRPLVREAPTIVPWFAFPDWSETVGPDESAGHAAALMIHGGFRHLPVVDGGDVVGMVSIRDLVRVSVDDEAPRGV